MILTGYLQLYIKIITIEDDKEFNHYTEIKTDFESFPVEVNSLVLLENIKNQLSKKVEVKEVAFCTKEEYENNKTANVYKRKCEECSCVDCVHTCHYYPTADSFDMDRVLVCTKTNRKSPDNEIGYGRKREDFPIPEWCPLKNN